MLECFYCLTTKLSCLLFPVWFIAQIKDPAETMSDDIKCLINIKDCKLMLIGQFTKTFIIHNDDHCFGARLPLRKKSVNI